MSAFLLNDFKIYQPFNSLPTFFSIGDQLMAADDFVKIVVPYFGMVFLMAAKTRRAYYFYGHSLFRVVRETS